MMVGSKSCSAMELKSAFTVTRYEKLCKSEPRAMEAAIRLA